MNFNIPFIVKELDSKSYHPLVVGELDGITINLILDTGASRTVIDSSLLKDYPVEKSDDESPFAAGINAEKMAVEQVILPRIFLGEIDFFDFTVFSTNLSPISSLYQQLAGIQINGLLGCDFLMNYQAIVDFNLNIIQLTKPTTTMAKEISRKNR